MDSYELFYLFPKGEVLNLQEYGSTIIAFGSDNMKESLYVRVCVKEGNKYLKVYEDNANSLGFLGYDNSELNLTLVDNVQDKKILKVRKLSNDKIQLVYEGKIMFISWLQASVSFVELYDNVNEEMFYKLRKVG